MGLFNFLNAGKTIATPVEAVGNALDKLFTSKQEKLQAEAVLKKIAQEPQILQAEINKMEAQHRSTFVAGARPFIIYVCGIGLIFVFLINPIIQWVTGKPGPVLPLDSIMELMFCILGLGGYRTIEKVNKVTK